MFYEIYYFESIFLFKKSNEILYIESKSRKTNFINTVGYVNNINNLKEQVGYNNVKIMLMELCQKNAKTNKLKRRKNS